MFNFAIVGFGGLGKAHFQNVEEVVNRTGEVKLVALCDIEENAFRTETATNLSENKSDFDISKYHLYTDVELMLKNENLDFIITALPTYLHEKIAVLAMEHGIHVFSEKPMAINLEQAQNMLDAAKKNNVKLMIGQCLRFFPSYVKLKQFIDSGKYGEVVQAEFIRLSKTPDWSWCDWMLDEEKSGTAILDLHVHDVNFIEWAFGMPKAVTSHTTSRKLKHESVFSIYHFDDEKLIIAKSDWAHSRSYPFTAEFSVRFEKATVELKNGEMWLYTNDDKEKIELSDDNGYILEIIEFINCIREDRGSEINSLESSMRTIEIALAERKSAETKTTVILEDKK